MGMRVLMVGSHLGYVQQMDACLERGLQQAGGDVKTFDYRSTRVAPPFLKKLIPHKIRHVLSPRRMPSVERADAEASNQEFLNVIEGFQPQVMIALRAERLGPASIEAARAKGVFCINWVGDDPEHFVPPQNVPAYDLWVTIDRTWSAWLENQGAREIRHLPVACDPSVHQAVEITGDERRKWASDLCFVGGFTPERESFLAAAAPEGLSIWGPNWDRAEEPFIKSCVREARMLEREEWLRAYAAAKVVLNIHSQGQECLNMRVFESLASGVCLLSDFKRDGEEFLGDALVMYKSPSELRERAAELIADDQKRLHLAERGQRLVTTQHTFEHRARQFLTWAQELRKS